MPRQLCLISLFVVLMGATIIRYSPYVFEWDDASYLEQSITMSRAVWSASAHAISQAIRRDVRPPIMMCLGIPWGPIESWKQSGRCFVTLAILNSLVVCL